MSFLRCFASFSPRSLGNVTLDLSSFHHYCLYCEPIFLKFYYISSVSVIFSTTIIPYCRRFFLQQVLLGRFLGRLTRVAWKKKKHYITSHFIFGYSDSGSKRFADKTSRLTIVRKKFVEIILFIIKYDFFFLRLSVSLQKYTHQQNTNVLPTFL
jgi:hypothetical protein